MAKQKAKEGQGKGAGKGNGKQRAVNFGSVGRNAEQADSGRSRKRNQARLLETHRGTEREAGTFYSRVNEGRFTDIAAALAGEAGSYAYPGGNEPSIHFNVTKEVCRTDTVSVIRFETIQRGHKLREALFDPKIFVPCHYVTKYGFGFRSNSKDRLAAATQELIVHYFAGEIGLTPSSVSEAVEGEKEINPIFQNASIDHKAMLAEVAGLYLVSSAEGDVVIQVFEKNDKACLRVKASMNPGICSSSAYFPAYFLFRPTLEQVTSDETYARQFALFMFLRTELSGLIASSKPVKRQRRQEHFPLQSKALPSPVVQEEAATTPVAKLAIAPAVPMKEKEAVDVTGHQPLTVLQFLKKDERGIFHHAQGEALAFFRREGIAGVPSFVLIAADNEHPLVSCLEKHGDVHVHLQDLVLNDRPYGDISDKRNARECVRQYLRQAAFLLGLRPKQTATPSVEPAVNKTA